LEGYGYLESLEQKDGKTLARIRVAHGLSFEDNASSDDIALYCVVEKPQLLFMMYALENKRLAGHSIFLSFRAAYSRFGNCLHGMSPEDPENMLVLYGKLQLISGWFQDGRWIFPETLREKTVRPISAAA
jgi:hypothetical protein